MTINVYLHWDKPFIKKTVKHTFNTQEQVDEYLSNFIAPFAPRKVTIRRDRP